MFRVQSLHVAPSFVPPRLTSSLDVQTASKLFSDVVARSEKPCVDHVSLAMRNFAVARGKAVSDRFTVASDAEAVVIFGAADLLFKTGKWARAAELLSTTYRNSTVHAIKRDAEQFHCAVLPPECKDQTSSRPSLEDYETPAAAAAAAVSAREEAASDAAARKGSGSNAHDQYLKWDAAVSPTRREKRIKVLEKDLRVLQDSIAAAQKVLREQERHVYFQQRSAGSSPSSSAAASAASMGQQKKRVVDAETQVRIERKRRSHHADFSLHFGRSLQQCNGVIISVMSISSSQQKRKGADFSKKQQLQRNSLSRLPLPVRNTFVHVISSLADLSTRSHALQVAIADAAAVVAMKSNKGNENNQQQQQKQNTGGTVVLSPTLSRSIWRVDPFWPTLSFDVLVARMLLEVPDVLRRELNPPPPPQQQQQQQRPSQETATVDENEDSSPKATLNDVEVGDVLKERDRIEDVLDKVLSSSSAEAAAHEETWNENDSQQQQQQQQKRTAEELQHHQRQIKFGQLFFRAAVVEPNFAGIALRALQFHGGREVLDLILECLSVFLTDAASSECAGSGSRRSVVVDDSSEIVDRVLERSSPNAASLWPFLQRLLEAVQEADSRALYVRRDRRLGATGFTPDWMKSLPDDPDPGRRNFDDESAAVGVSSSSSNSSPSSSSSSRHQQNRLLLELNARRFIVIVDLICDLAWQTLTAVVSGKSTINAARTAAMPVIRLACETAALLPSLDVRQMLPLIFVASQGLGISAWGGNLKLPLARFMWFPMSSSSSSSSSTSGGYALLHQVLNEKQQSFDWSKQDKHGELAPRRAGEFCRIVFAQLQLQQQQQHREESAKSTTAAAAAAVSLATGPRGDSSSSSSAPLSSFGSAVLPPQHQQQNARAPIAWQQALRLLSPLTQHNGFTPLHQKLMLVACADARAWEVGLVLFARHSRSVPATQASVAILLDFLRESNVTDPGSRAIQLVLESHITNNNRSSSGDGGGSAASVGRPTQTVMLRLCRLVADSPHSFREPHAAMRFFSSLERDGALSNAIENCGPNSFAPFLNLAATSKILNNGGGGGGTGWKDAALVLSTMIQRRRFFSVDQLAPLVKPESVVRARWQEMMRLFMRAAAATASRAQSSSDVDCKGAAGTFSKEVALAASIALAAAHDASACRGVVAAIDQRHGRELGWSQARRSRGGGGGGGGNNVLRMNVHTLCSYNENALLVVERELGSL